MSSSTDSVIALTPKPLPEYNENRQQLEEWGALYVDPRHHTVGNRMSFLHVPGLILENKRLEYLGLVDMSLPDNYYIHGITAFFPHLKHPWADHPITIMGECWERYAMALFNLHYQIQREGWLSTSMLSAGLRLVLRDLEDQVWVPQRSAWLENAAPGSSDLGARVHSVVRQSRYHIWPINCLNGTHWKLGVCDMYTRQVILFDSLWKHDISEKETNDWLDRYPAFLVRNQLCSAADADMFTRHRVKRSKQMDGWSCGLHVITNAEYHIRMRNIDERQDLRDWESNPKITPEIGKKWRFSSGGSTRWLMDTLGKEITAELGCVLPGVNMIPRSMCTSLSN